MKHTGQMALITAICMMLMTFSGVVATTEMTAAAAALPDDYAETFSIYGSALVDMDLLSGMGGEDNLRIGSNVTREQAITMILSFMNESSSANVLTEKETSEALEKYKDKAKISDWARKFVAYATIHGYIGGRTDGSYDPAGNVKGYEFAVMMLNGMGYRPGNDYAVTIAMKEISEEEGFNISKSEKRYLGTLDATAISRGDCMAIFYGALNAKRADGMRQLDSLIAAGRLTQELTDKKYMIIRETEPDKPSEPDKPAETDISARPIPAQPTGGNTPVELYGKLQVIGSRLCDASGEPVQLRGMSSHGLQWYGEYCNYDVIKWLRDDWKCTVYRAAMYTDEDGYIFDKSLKYKVYEAVDACIELGMYIIVDWHMLMDNDPLMYKDEAIEFFREITEHYGDCPNILYEIMNEPSGWDVTWTENCKPYAKAVIPVIRENAPDNIILVGNPSWSSLRYEVIESPLKIYTNIAYTVHLYTNESYGSWPLERMTAAMEKGMCVFVSEWGCTDADGDGEVLADRAKVFLDYLDENMISWVNWNISNKNEASACLKSKRANGGKKPSTSGGWKVDELSESGVFIREQLRTGYAE